MAGDALLIFLALTRCNASQLDKLKERNLMFSRSSLLAIVWVVLAVALASATAGDRNAELLTKAQMLNITGADVANCDSRFYEYTCNNLDSKNNPGACIGKPANKCTGS